MTSRFALRLFRLAVLCVAAWLLNLAAKQIPPATDIPLEVIRELFPDVVRITSRDDRQRDLLVLAADGRMLGSVLTTSPDTDDLIGYAGPSNLLVALDLDGRVRGVRLLSSGDTVAHMDAIRDHEPFWNSFVGWTPASQPLPQVDAVSGSTLTSLTIAEAVERRLAGKAVSRRFPQPLSLDEVREVFTDANELHADDPRLGWHRVVDRSGTTLGFVVRTSPSSDNVRGYRGPTESLAAIAADGRTVIAVKLRRSYDTREYVDRVREDSDYLALLAGRSVDAWSKLDFAQAGIEGVSGATQTSFAVAEGLRRRFAADVVAREQETAAFRRWPRSAGLLAVIIGAMLIAFTPLRANRRLRLIWQVVLIAGFGLWFGDLLSLALFAGWTRNGVPWQTAPALVLLAVVALVTPWTTRRNIYCQQLCPHGAAQEWLGRFRRWHVRLPEGVASWLQRIPALLLLLSFLLAITAVRFDLAQLEPFDAWVLRGVAVASAIIAVAGLLASIFVPQAYCRFGCPTGALLKFIRRGGSRDHFTRRDGIACSLLAVAAVLLLIRFRDSQQSGDIAQPAEKHQRIASVHDGQTKLSGRAFGTTWSVKLRGSQEQPDDLRDRISAELRRIETTLSHWRPESATAQFNASETTLETDQPDELIALVSQALELSRVTNGAFDITVAPLVQAWGYGPSGPPAAPPSEAALSRLLERVGSEKLVLDSATKTLRKQHPGLQLDLGALLQGHAVDRIAELLESQPADFLIEVGGELRTRGEWTVAIENPSNPAEPLRTLALKNASLATSGTYRSSQALGDERAHHFISSRTGRPIAATVQLCAVLSPKCVDADGWATALLLVGLPEALRLADEHGLTVWLVDQNGQVQTNALTGQPLAP